MSYAGLLSLLYADVDREDPRVQSAIRWVRASYSFAENVNLGDHGRYYYYYVMAKALQAYGERHLELEGGEIHDWPREMADHLLALQRPDGSWVNEGSHRWMEGDPVLVTAYVVRALSCCWEVIHQDEPPPVPGE
jgi:squalene-hopene/tetraprenyl-beta-curcumene cyclase